MNLLERAVGKAQGLAATMDALMHFATNRREMVALHLKHTRKSVFREVDFRDVLGDTKPESMLLSLASDIYGDVAWWELVVLAALVGRHQPRRLFEFGTFRGKTTMHLAANSPEDAQVFTLDLPEEGFDAIRQNIEYDANLLGGGSRQEVGALYKRSAWAGKVKQLFANSLEFDETPYKETIDFVFVDADHNYGSVVNDTRKAMAMLRKKPGSVILWHDLRPGNDVERGIVDVCGTDKVQAIQGTMFAIHRL